MKKRHSVRTIILAGSLLLQLSTLCYHSRGAAGDVDLSFDPGSGVNGTVNAVALQPDGKFIIGGAFTTVKGLARSKVARLNAGGSGDAAFNPGTGANDVVSSLALQSDGKVLIGGDFTAINGTNRNRIARLNADGGLASSFSPVIGTYGIASIVLQSDGKALIGGGFTAVNGTNRNGIARLNTNGSLDGSFNPGTGVQNDGNPGGIRSLVVQSDGKVLIGGGFNTVNGTNRNRIARLNANGSLDGSFNPGTGVAGAYVSAIALQPDGKVLIAGDFYALNGTNRNNIARLNASGSLDTSFDPGTGENSNRTVLSVALQPDGKVLIGGMFTIINGMNRSRIARLNANGSLDGSFNPGTAVNGVARPYVARLYGDSAPSLNLARSNAFVIVSWPVTGLNFHLQESTNLSLPYSWSSVAQLAVTNANQVRVTVPTTAPRKFFRLKSP